MCIVQLQPCSFLAVNHVYLYQVRTWHGDIADVPPAQGPADAVFLNAVFGNVFDQRAALLAAALLLRPGGSVVISHPLGRWGYCWPSVAWE